LASSQFLGTRKYNLNIAYRIDPQELGDRLKALTIGTLDLEWLAVTFGTDKRGMASRHVRQLQVDEGAPPQYVCCMGVIPIVNEIPAVINLRSILHGQDT